MGEINYKFSKCVGSAILKVKYLGERMNPEYDMFEDIVSSSDTVIKLDFFNGISLVEDKFRNSDKPFDKFFLEFFDDYNKEDFISYLTSDSSDFRATTSDGVIVRTCKNDLMAMEIDRTVDVSKNKDRYKNMFHKIERMFVWK